MDYLIIHQRAIELAREYETTESKLIEILQIVNREKVYKAFGYTSLFTYAVEALKLPPDRVYQFNVVAKKCDEVPELKKAIDHGILNVSRARRIASVIQKETSQEWIEKAVVLPQRELEKEVARVNPKEALPEKIRVLNDKDAYISLSISIEAQEQLERLKDLLSQKEGRPVTLRDVIEFAAQFTLEKLDPVRKAERNVRSLPKAPILSSRTKGRVPIPANIKHEVFFRDRGQCTQVVHGKRCESRRWIQVHHIKPVFRGGGNSPENLITLCASHHQMQHDQSTRSLVTVSARSLPRGVNRMELPS